MNIPDLIEVPRVSHFKPTDFVLVQHTKKLPSGEPIVYWRNALYIDGSVEKGIHNVRYTDGTCEKIHDPARIVKALLS